MISHKEALTIIDLTAEHAPVWMKDLKKYVKALKKQNKVLWKNITHEWGCPKVCYKVPGVKNTFAAWGYHEADLDEIKKAKCTCEVGKLKAMK